MTHPFPPLNQQFCGNCRYFRSAECRHSPPSLVADSDTSYYRFPLVKATDWCGKWVPVEERQ